MIVSFNIKAHSFFITEQAVSELYVKVYREMRRKPFVGMKQPAPFDSIMGMDTIAFAKYKGQPAVNLKWELYKDGKLLGDGITDHAGMVYELSVELCDGCKCAPQWFRDSFSSSKKDKDINNRLCSEILPEYQLQFDLSSLLA